MKIFYVNNEGQEVTIDTNEIDVFVLCDECNGEGTEEEINCVNPSSECCGGCYKTVDCSECDGSKMTNINELI